MPGRDVGIEDRLQRIRENRATRDPSAVHKRSRPIGSIQASPAAKRVGPKWYAMLIGLGGVIAIATLSAAAFLSDTRLAFPVPTFWFLANDTQRDQLSLLQDGDVHPLKGKTHALGHQSLDMERFLPSPPQGWSRITHSEACAPSPLATLNASWPDVSRTEARPLYANLGYARLKTFISRNRNCADSNLQRAAAIYLAHEGPFLEITIRDIALPDIGGKTQARIQSLAVGADPATTALQDLGVSTFDGANVLNNALKLEAGDQSDPPHQNPDELVPIKFVALVHKGLLLDIRGIARITDVGALLTSSGSTRHDATLR